MIATLLARIEERPGAAFVAFAIVHVALWTLLPTLLYPNLALDLIEARTYGPEWQFGYDKLPPLPWWLIEAIWRLAGHDFALYLLSALGVAAALACVWRCALPMVGGAGALASVLIADGVHYLNFTAPKFNHDVVQLPFWGLAGLAFHRAIKTGRLAAWVLLGFTLGMAFWAKYFVIVLAIPLVLYFLINRTARRVLATPGPYIAIAVGLIVISPHLIWLVRNDFLPLAYAEGRAAPVDGPLDHLVRPLIFAGGGSHLVRK